MKIILASNSPRRKDILTKFGYEFTVIKSDFEECNEDDLPINIAKNNAFGKAKDVFEKLDDKNAIVIGADTIVVLDGKIIGKPKDRKDAISTLHNLSDKTHEVITGYSIITATKTVCDYDRSLVAFEKFSEELIEEYVKTGKPMDKAGSYGLQDGFVKEKEIKGSRYNVIGLPIEKIKPIIDDMLKK